MISKRRECLPPCTSESNAYSHLVRLLFYPAALHAMMGSDIHHRTEDFRKLYKPVLADLKEVMGTSNDVLVLVASGTGGLEAAAQNFFSPGDKVIVCSAGKFGERWAEIVKAYGLEATVLTAPYGDVVKPEAVEAALAAEPAHSRACSCRLRKHPPAPRTTWKPWGGRQEDGRDLRGRRDHRPRHHAARYRRLGPRCRDRRIAEGVHDPSGAGFHLDQPEGVDARRDLATCRTSTSI